MAMFDIKMFSQNILDMLFDKVCGKEYNSIVITIFSSQLVVLPCNDEYYDIEADYFKAVTLSKKVFKENWNGGLVIRRNMQDDYEIFAASNGWDGFQREDFED